MKTIDANMTRDKWNHLNQNRNILRGYSNGTMSNSVWNLANSVVEYLFKLQELSVLTDGIHMSIIPQQQHICFQIKCGNQRYLISVGNCSVTVVQHICLKSNNQIIQSWRKPLMMSNMGLNAFLNNCFRSQLSII
jgi:hypothetical protein